MNALETHRLGKRYGGTWALRDCTLAIPEGHLAALVGPNGAGKTTLLNLAVGLTAATGGEVTVLGGAAAGSPTALAGVAYVAQDMPLYRQLTVRDTLRMASGLNRGFDAVCASARLRDLGIPDGQRTGKLSGGQRAQLALTLALARHPRLLVLDEPTAPLDPIARHDFMASVMAAMADDGLSVLLSSHVLAELERVADYLVLITAGRVCLAGTVEELTAAHRLVTGPADHVVRPGWRVIEATAAGAQQQLLVHVSRQTDPPPPGWQARSVGIEELTMAYLRQTPVAAAPALVGATR